MEGIRPTLRVATPADALRIEALMKASIAAIFPAYYDAEQTASARRYIAKPDPTLVEDGTYFVLEVGDELVGCGGWSRRGRPYMGSDTAHDDDRLLDPATEPAHVRAMFVRQDWMRRGLGRRILEECEAAAHRAGFRRLELVATLPGVPLYEAFGFTPTAEIADIALVDGIPLPCLAMSKSIGPNPGRRSPDAFRGSWLSQRALIEPTLQSEES
jgi:GNAT superfamily N-acetyltransferase